MREKVQKQMPLMEPATNHDQAKELEAINAILNKNPTICDLVYQDLCAKRSTNTRRGARGMSAEQVLRAAILKALFGFTYKELAFHLIDSRTLRWFCLIGIADKGFKKSVLNKNIKALSADTWEQINQQLLGQAKEEKTEKAREVRIDCTVVETNIHAPTDSSLLYDTVRVLTRLLQAAKEACGSSKGIVFKDHCRRAKRRMIGIQYARKERQRNSCYRDLLKVARNSLGYSLRAISWIDAHGNALELLAIAGQLRHYCDLTEKVISQTERRVIAGEKVPAAEKIFSIFEPHTDIIIKDRRDKFYGHKICLTGGGSNLILDCLITDGNPADSTLTQTMIERQRQIYGRCPLKAALDGGFASKDNLRQAKASGVKDVCFAKKRGLEVEDMCRSDYVYNRLGDSGPGSSPDLLVKAQLRVVRCTWKGYRAFKSLCGARLSRPTC